MSLNASAAGSDPADDPYADAPNLIDPSAFEVVQWGEEFGHFSFQYYKSNDLCIFTGSAGGYGIVGSAVTPSDYIAGHSYMLSFDCYSASNFSSGTLFCGLSDGYGSEADFSDFYEMKPGTLVNSRHYSFTFVGEDLANPSVAFLLNTPAGVAQFSVRLQHVRLIDVTAAEADAQTNKIGGFISDLGDKIQGFFEQLIEDIKGLFVPSEDAITSFKDDISAIFEEHLGFIYAIGTVLDRTIDTIVDIFDNYSSGDLSFTLPALDFEFLGMDIHLWDDTTISFDFLDEIPVLDTLYTLYSVMLNIICIVALVQYGEKIYKELFST